MLCRSHRVIFSDKAVIRCVDGKFYFSFQVYDLEKKIPLVEAHCRCYAVYSVCLSLFVSQELF